MDPTQDAQTDEEDYNIAPPIFIDNDDSGSSYRASSESADEGHRTKERPRDSSGQVKGLATTEGDLEGPPEISTRVSNEYTDERIKNDAARWAATFEPPPQPDDFLNRRRSVSASPQERSPSPIKYEAEAIRARRYLRDKEHQRFYNDDYRQLLNIEIENITSHSSPSDFPPPVNSLISCSTWTSTEKEAFFTALGRLGKDNISGIATRIGSKSKLQVQEYIDLLHYNLVAKNGLDYRVKGLDLTNFPAAQQISQKCCESLEQAGDALALREERYEEAHEQEEWGTDSWLLTADVNSWVESQLAKPGGEHAVAEVVPAAQLLNLANWLETSTRVFMNPAGREDENWRSLVQQGEEHGIRTTAFSDFENLTISITKRLISATIFCTEARLRARDMNTRQRQEAVTTEDVEAAAQNIGLSLNSHEFWKKCPRRNHLQVFQRLATSYEGKTPMDYDDVEDQLYKFTSRSRSRSRSRSASVSRSRASSVSTINASDIDVSSDEEGSVAGSNTRREGDYAEAETEAVNDATAQSKGGKVTGSYTHGSPARQPPSPPPTGSPHTPRPTKTPSSESHQEAYVEAFDMSSSMAEEARLWALLKQEPPFLVKAEAELPKLPNTRKREHDAMLDWRENVKYWSPWEVHDKPPAMEAFATNQRIANKRRRLERDVPETDGEELTTEAEDGTSQVYDESEDEVELSDQEIESQPEEHQGDEEYYYPEEAAMDEVNAPIWEDEYGETGVGQDDTERLDEETESRAQGDPRYTRHVPRDAVTYEGRKSTSRNEEDRRYASPVFDTEQLDLFLDDPLDMEAMMPVSPVGEYESDASEDEPYVSTEGDDDSDARRGSL